MAGFVKRFLELPSASGILLLLATVLAMACANTAGIADLYAGLLATPFELRIGSLELKKNFLLVINDGLMAIFFLLVAMEIKRELLEGELTRDKIALPAFGALGGIVLPALIYMFITRSDPTARAGWAIPSATDIAFSLGVLSVLGRRVPTSLRIFLMSLAVLDDLAAIAIIATFYAGNLFMPALIQALIGLGVLILFNRMNVTRLAVFMVVGVVMWVCVLKSGVHATLAGVALGFTIPIRCGVARGAGLPQVGADSPLRALEHALHPWVNYLILPLFAFANAGVSFAGVTAGIFTAPVTLGISLGLICGKTLGVFAASLLAVKLRLATLPVGVRPVDMLGMGALAGIGFTMSLFIGTLAFQQSALEYSVATRVGVLGGSTISAILGLILLAITLKRSPADLRQGAQ